MQQSELKLYQDEHSPKHYIYGHITLSAPAMDKLPGPVLQILQQCQERGYPLTWNAIGDGNHTTVTLTWNAPQQQKHFSKTFSRTKKRKSPCQRRRDQQRLERWKERRKEKLRPKDFSGGQGGVSVNSVHTDKCTKEFGIQTLVSPSKENSTNTVPVVSLEKGTEFKPSQRDKYCQTFKSIDGKGTQTVMASNNKCSSFQAVQTDDIPATEMPQSLQKQYDIQVKSWKNKDNLHYDRISDIPNFGPHNFMLDKEHGWTRHINASPPEFSHAKGVKYPHIVRHNWEGTGKEYFTMNRQDLL